MLAPGASCRLSWIWPLPAWELGQGWAGVSNFQPPPLSRLAHEVHRSLEAWVEVPIVLGAAGTLMGVWEAVISFQWVF